MFLSILNNGETIQTENQFSLNSEKYKTIKFESYSSKNTRQEYDNGEIIIYFIGVVYNFDKLLEWYNDNDKSRIRTYTDILVNIYKKHGFDYMLNVVDGVFSLILLDQRINNQESTIYVIRDVLGITPLYAMTPLIDESIDRTRNTYRYLSQSTINDVKCNQFIRGFSTSYDVLMELCSGLNKGSNISNYKINKLQLGFYHKYTVSNKVSCVWEVHKSPIKTFELGYCGSINSSQSIEKVERNVRKYISDSIDKRMRIIKNSIIVCVVNQNDFESIIIACLINQYLILNETDNYFEIFFTESNNYTSYLQEVF